MTNRPRRFLPSVSLLIAFDAVIQAGSASAAGRPTASFYGIERETVIVYRIRAFKQDAIGPGDLA